MRIRRKKLLLLGFALALIAATLFLTRNREPRYDGHPLSDWVLVYAGDLSIDDGAYRAKEAVRHIGTNAIPYLLKWISRETNGTPMVTHINIPIRWLNRKLAPKSNWSLKDKSWYLDYGSSRAFAALGSTAKPAIPELKRLLEGSNGIEAQFSAALALGNLGPLGFSTLAVARTNSNPYVRAFAAEGIGRLGTNAEPLIPVLLKALDDPLGRVDAFRAIESLGPVKLRPDIVIPAMIATFQAGERLDVIRVSYLLGEYGSLARPALPALLRALDKQTTPQTSPSATLSLRQSVESTPKLSRTSHNPLLTLRRAELFPPSIFISVFNFSTLNFRHSRFPHWMFGVRCWLLDVSHFSFQPSALGVFGA